MYQILYNKDTVESIDMAVLEPASIGNYTLKMITLNAGWNDVGPWDAVWDVQNKDDNKNVIICDVITSNGNNCLLYATSRHVGLVEVEDLIVVETADAVLVAKRNQSQQVKKIVDILNNNRRKEQNLNRKVHRLIALMPENFL